MQIFLDSADLSLIKKYNDWGIIDGVTTNPSIIAKEGVNLKSRILEICEVVDGPISAEVIGLTAEEMITEGRQIAAWHKNVYVKIPMTSEGLKAVKVLSAEGIYTNVTLIFTASQALLAAKAGATLVSPFVGRVDDISGNGLHLIETIVHAFKNYKITTKVLAASLRNPFHFVECMKIGADIVTIPPKMLDQLVAHPQTDSGIAAFLKDWEGMQKKEN